jgi:alpha-tubulin suppressor-like RCC1 family protein
MKNIKKHFPQKGYLLPAVIFLGLGISVMSGTFLRYTSMSSETLNNQSYENIALEAANSGMNYAGSCMVQAIDWSESTPLRPNTACDGTGNTGSAYVTVNGTEWRSTFSVAPRDAQDNVVSTGIVEILSGSTVVDTITATTKMNLGNQYDELLPSVGETVTDLANDYDDCAIANGKLYCWGGSDLPALVGGALAGKTVTRISVSDNSKCAIGDGIPYCWGNDGSQQLGNGGGWHRSEPSADSPTKDSGPLDGKFVTDISTASFNNPASVIWPFASAFQHSCALTEDGAVSCWGYGGFRQNTGGGQRCAWIIICIPVIGYVSYPSHDSPELVVHYKDNDQLLSGKKSERVGASSHDSCVLSQGELICWGVPAPINILCNSVLFSDADLTLVPFNPCVWGYSNGYNTHNLWGSALSGKFIDHNLWNLSANETCHMADRNFVCFGTTPAFGSFWIDSWGSPWVPPFLSNPDVTSTDNGDDVGSMGLVGLYCIVDRGVGKCSGSPLNLHVGSGGIGVWKVFQTLNGSSGLAGKVATKIAARGYGGCVAANGQLFCWGASHTQFPSLHGETVIGTQEGRTAATGPISAGGEHGCGVANGKLYCWGENQYGQLGLGTTNDTAQPQNIPAFNAFNSVTDVSAGANHTCAIVYGSLYCWGRNNNGQLGLGDTTDRNAPVKVNFPSDARVTEVDAGATGTCAVANGRAYCWGLNSNGQVGDSTTTQRTSPTVVGTINNFATTSITMGSTHACAVANSDLYCWGSNANGRTGLNTTAGNANPTLVTGGTAGSPTMNGMRPRVSNVSAGGDFTCAVINSKASCWGNNANGATGRNTTAGNQLTPATIHGTAGTYFATKVTAGDSHACGLIHGNSSATNGNLWCWGNGADGRLGVGNTTSYSTAQLVNCGATMTVHATCTGTRRVVTNIDAGGASTCGVANGVIICMGEGGSGRLGNGLLTDSLRPSPSANFRSLSSYEKGPIF